MTRTQSQSEVSLTSLLIYTVQSSAGRMVNSSAFMVVVEVVIVFVGQVRQLAHDRNTCHET